MQRSWQNRHGLDHGLCWLIGAFGFLGAYGLSKTAVVFAASAGARARRGAYGLSKKAAVFAASALVACAPADGEKKVERQKGVE